MIIIIQGRTYSSKNLLHAVHLYSKDGKLMEDMLRSVSRNLYDVLDACTPFTTLTIASESLITILPMLQILMRQKQSTKSDRWNPPLRSPTIGSTVL